VTDIPQQQLLKDALRRLKETEISGGRRLFTSDLTVNEFLLVEEAGFKYVDGTPVDGSPRHSPAFWGRRRLPSSTNAPHPRALGLVDGQAPI